MLCKFPDISTDIAGFLEHGQDLGIALISNRSEMKTKIFRDFNPNHAIFCAS
jgi:hypothetical protein